MRFWKDNQSLMWKHQYETVCITPWGKNALRIRATKFPGFTAHDWALEEPVPDTSADVSITIGKDESTKTPRWSENPQGISPGLRPACMPREQMPQNPRAGVQGDCRRRLYDETAL